MCKIWFCIINPVTVDSATLDRNAVCGSQARVKVHYVAYSTPENMLFLIGIILSYKTDHITYWNPDY